MQSGPQKIKVKLNEITKLPLSPETVEDFNNIIKDPTLGNFPITDTDKFNYFDKGSIFSKVFQGDLAAVFDYIATIKDIDELNITCKGGYTLLMIAAAKGHIEILTALCIKSASFTKRSDKDETPMILAVKADNLEVFQYLFSQFQYEDHLLGLLLQASKYNSVKIVNFLLNIFITVFNTSDFDTYVFFVMKWANKDLLKLIDSKGISLTQENSKKETPLLQAIQFENINAVEYLSPNIEDILKINQHGFSPFAFACYHGKYDIVDKWLNRYKNIQFHEDKLETSGIFLATIAKELGVFFLLVSNFIDSISEDDFNKKSSAYIRLDDIAFVANSIGISDIINGLLKSKLISPNITNNAGDTLLTAAIKLGNFEIVEILLREDYKADLNIRANNGDSLLVLALQQFNSPKILLNVSGKARLLNYKEYQELVKQDPDCSITKTFFHKMLKEHQNTVDIPILYDAQSNNSLKIAKLLINKGFNPFAIDKSNLSPFKLICQLTNQELLNCLVEKNPSILQNKNKYNEGLDYALSSGLVQAKNFLALNGSAQFKTDSLETMFSVAIKNDDVEILNRILNINEKLDLTVNPKGHNAFVLSAIHCSYDVLDYLGYNHPDLTQSINNGGRDVFLSIINHLDINDFDTVLPVVFGAGKSAKTIPSFMYDNNGNIVDVAAVKWIAKRWYMEYNLKRKVNKNYSGPSKMDEKGFVDLYNKHKKNKQDLKDSSRSISSPTNKNNKSKKKKRLKKLNCRITSFGDFLDKQKSRLQDIKSNLAQYTFTSAELSSKSNLLAKVDELNQLIESQQILTEKDYKSVYNAVKADVSSNKLDIIQKVDDEINPVFREINAKEDSVLEHFSHIVKLKDKLLDYNASYKKSIKNLKRKNKKNRRNERKLEEHLENLAKKIKSLNAEINQYEDRFKLLQDIKFSNHEGGQYHILLEECQDLINKSNQLQDEYSKIIRLQFSDSSYEKKVEFLKKTKRELDNIINKLNVHLKELKKKNDQVILILQNDINNLFNQDSINLLQKTNNAIINEINSILSECRSNLSKIKVSSSNKKRQKNKINTLKKNITNLAKDVKSYHELPGKLSTLYADLTDTFEAFEINYNKLKNYIEYFISQHNKFSKSNKSLISIKKSTLRNFNKLKPYIPGMRQPASVNQKVKVIPNSSLASISEQADGHETTASIPMPDDDLVTKFEGLNLSTTDNPLKFKFSGISLPEPVNLKFYKRSYKNLVIIDDSSGVVGELTPSIPLMDDGLNLSTDVPLESRIEVDKSVKFEQRYILGPNLDLEIDTLIASLVCDKYLQISINQQSPIGLFPKKLYPSFSLNKEIDVHDNELADNVPLLSNEEIQAYKVFNKVDSPRKSSRYEDIFTNNLNQRSKYLDFPQPLTPSNLNKNAKPFFPQKDNFPTSKKSENRNHKPKSRVTTYTNTRPNRTANVLMYNYNNSNQNSKPPLSPSYQSVRNGNRYNSK